jgi:hypothetical protein
MASSSAAASERSLAIRAEGSTQAQLGPGLTEGMGEASLVAALNAWGAARDHDLLDLQADLGSTRVGVSAAFDQAKEALQRIVTDFRVEAEALRQHGQYEAASSVGRLEQVVIEARTRFDAQDARFADDLSELARRLAMVDAWAQAEPTRVAAMVQPRSPGGTPLSFYPSPGLAQQQQPPWAPQTPQRSQQQQPPQTPQQPQRPQQQQDPWAAGAAAAAPDPWAAGRAAQSPEGQRHFDIGTPGDKGGGKGMYPYPREMRIDARSWGDHKKLDVATSFEAFQVWKDRGLMFLSRERPDVRRLLTWAETQSKDGLEAELPAQAARFGISDLTAVEYATHDGIKVIILDSLLGRARNCVEKGCELWRSLCAEWSGAAPQLKQAKARRYQEPPRCKDVAELWSRLPAWERLGEEVKLSGLEVPEWMRNAALEKLLPAALLGTLVARPELATYAVRLTWVKTQMEHARGLAQATAYAPGAAKDTSGDINMGSLEAYAEAGDGDDWWAQAESLQAAINALSKGKGKGKNNFSKGGGGKGGPKGKSGDSDFNGTCHHCGMWGHRKSNCMRLDTEMAKKGAKGGKGGPKGGKGPYLAECAEEAAYDEGLGAELGDDITGEEWYFEHGISSVRAAAPAGAPTPLRRHGLARAPAGKGASQTTRPPCTRQLPAAATAARQQQQTRRTAAAARPQQQQQPAQVEALGWQSRWHLRGANGGAIPATETRNSFAALSLLVDDAEPALLGAVSSAEVRGGRVVEAVVDSGAVHSVAPPSRFPGPMVPSPWSRAGRGYRAANGTGIKNLGQVQVAFGTSEGHRCNIPFQVAEVEQPLLSVAHLTAAGNKVELGANDGRIVNVLTGRTIALEKRGGVYLLKMFIPDTSTAAPFGRQGA